MNESDQSPPGTFTDASPERLRAMFPDLAILPEAPPARSRPPARGMGRVYQRGRVWWIEYWRRGRQYRESTRSPEEAKAYKLLKKRLGEIAGNKFVGPQEERVSYDDLEKLYLQDYDVRGLRSKDTAAYRTAHLKTFFGLDRAVDISPARLRAYQAARLAEKAEPATTNREMAALHRMLRLAVKQGLLSAAPVFPERLEERPPRQGFFEHGEYLAVRKHLQPDYQDALDFYYLTGWRRKVIRDFGWDAVDLNGEVLRLSPELSKNKTGVVFPINAPLRAVLERRLTARRPNVALVFHRKGRPIGDWRKAWKEACKQAKVPGKLLHDCRRTAARNLVRAGVPERVAMALLGHKTRSVFDRYNVVNESDLKQAAGRLADYMAAQPATVEDKGKANPETVAPAQGS